MLDSPPACASPPSVALRLARCGAFVDERRNVSATKEPEC
jgi:hypothetical protein